MIHYNPKIAAIAACVLLAVGSATTVSARELATGPATYSVVLRYIDMHPRSAKAAGAVLNRIGKAALEVCGASSGSLHDVKAGVRASACWRDSVADAVARIGDPMLADAYARRRTPGRSSNEPLRVASDSR